MRLLALLLRLGGAVLCTAFLAMFLPTAWMASTHEWIGLGAFPRSAVVEYLTRSIAALYGFHGVLLFIIARDVVRFAAIVRYIGVMNVLFGSMMTVIDLDAGMPTLWTLFEGPPVVGMGAAILYLSQSIPRERPR
jgi:hypothetical protein